MHPLTAGFPNPAAAYSLGLMPGMGALAGLPSGGLRSAVSSGSAGGLVMGSGGNALGYAPVTNRGDNPPCNTLFIGNLSDQVRVSACHKQTLHVHPCCNDLW